MIWRTRHHEFRFPRPTLVMGVVNVTPDSFSDGGLYLDPEAAVVHACELVARGADLLDIGGESTRPGAAPVSEAEELRRVIPVIERLRARVSVPLSVDTCKASVAAAAVAAGAGIVNDVGTHGGDPEMAAVVARSGAGYIAMHMQGTPATMQVAPHYDDVVGEVGGFLATALRALERAGVGRDQVVLDPGIGFGKALEHNLELLARLGAFRELGRPLVLGVSRKSFIGRLLGTPVADRLPGSLAATCLAVTAGVAVIRTHDVAETCQAVRVTEAIEARRKAVAPAPAPDPASAR